MYKHSKTEETQEKLLKNKTIVLLGRPLSTNSLYRHRGNHVYMTEQGKNLKRSYHYEVQQQWREPPIEHNNIQISVELYFDDKRRRDWDNYHKLTMDALNGIVWKDDQQIRKAIVTKNFSKESPCIIIDVKY